MPQLRVLLAAEDVERIKNMRAKIAEAGHLLIGQAREAQEFLRIGFETQPDLIFLDPNLPDFGGVGVPQVLDEQRLAPVIYVTDNPAEVLHLLDLGIVVHFLLHPFSTEEMHLAVETCLVNFEYILGLEQESRRLSKSLEARKLVEQAKGLLAETKGWSEAEAYKYLQKISMNTARPMSFVARETIKILKNPKR